MQKRGVEQVKLWHSLAVDKLGGKCYICGTKDKLQIHHKDKNWRNNKNNNLVLLCQSCHQKQHGARIGFIDTPESIFIKKWVNSPLFKAF